MTITGPGGAATLNRETDMPIAILRDPGTGQVRAFLRDLPAARRKRTRRPRSQAGLAWKCCSAAGYRTPRGVAEVTV